MKRLLLLAVCLGVIAPFMAYSFDEHDFYEFREQNANMTPQGLWNMYPPGLYNAESRTNGGVNYLNDAESKFELTDCEMQLLRQNGFVVTERLSYGSMWTALEDIWNKDIPLMVTSDMVLHALHMSYDAILKDIERNMIIPELSSALEEMSGEIRNKATVYQNDPIMMEALKDSDIYITVARRLLANKNISPAINDSEVKSEISHILNQIKEENPVKEELFGIIRFYDYSQFTPRGHYTDSEELTRYFQSMMWLGRTEFYLIPPKSNDVEVTPEQNRLNIITSVILLEAAENSGAYGRLQNINKAIEAIVGESDNTQMHQMREVLNEASINGAAQLVSLGECEKFREILAVKSYAGQKILSQMLEAFPNSAEEKIEPASAFLLMGQRFIIDSYVFSNLVFDKVDCRLMPSSLDVLFALGNNASGDLLKGEFEACNYTSDLAAMRYLIDSYDEDYWQSTFYTSWLNSIKALNPPDEDDREYLPGFMKTAAWWQQKMNTQLASWAQLRHDNLLYAKQSYTGMAGCSYPDVYVEPIPEFYSAIKKLADNAEGTLGGIMPTSYIRQYFKELESLADTLQGISEKILNRTPLSAEEITFVRNTYSYANMGCVQAPSGWFAKMFYNPGDEEVEDLVIADVHTVPTDWAGNLVGWIMHAGTGNVNMMLVVTENHNGKLTAFAGPVLSYYEYVSSNFKRLNDEEWAEGDFYKENGIRPEFTDIYLADENGECDLSNLLMLPVSVEDDTPVQTADVKFRVYPNPVAESSMLSFRVPYTLSGDHGTVDIYDMSGNHIKNIFKGPMPATTLSARIDATDAQGNELSPGAYIISVTIGGNSYNSKIIVSGK
ncbi:MAG: DUF3160 domain-containing protein [Bacteroidota bacterium]